MLKSKPTANWLKRFFQGAKTSLAYVLSLPERSLRSLAALVGGGTSLLTETLLPNVLRESSIYRITVGLFQDFLIQRVAGIENEVLNDKTKLKNKFIQRKMLGNVLEAAGLLTMRFSPLWVLALAADTAAGSKTFLNRLVQQLKDNKVISESAQADDLVDVLSAIQKASQTSASAMDMPPLSRDELLALSLELKSSYSQVVKETGDLLKELDEIWTDMTQLAKKEQVSLERLMGIMTIDAAQFLKKSAGAMYSVGQTGVFLFDEGILESYRMTLKRLSIIGVDGYLSQHLQPFLLSAKEHFNPARKTGLERFLGR